jgi:hypothetical protein
MIPTQGPGFWPLFWEILLEATGTVAPALKRLLQPDLVPDDRNGAIPDIFVHDRKKDTTTLLSRTTDGANAESLESAISANRKHAAFSSAALNFVPGDGTGFQDIFVASRFDWLV